MPASDPQTVAEQSLPVVQLNTRWPRGASATLWLLQPPASDLSHEAPYHHPAAASVSPLELLRAAIQKDAELQPDGPVFFLLPELTVGAAELPELRAIGTELAPDRVIVAGLGHLNQQQCDMVEAGVGSAANLWLSSWTADRYANGAAVLEGNRCWLEAKNWPSPFEEQENCHQAHVRLRLFQCAGFSFAVVICSELNKASANNYFDRLAEARPDLVVWLQHNPSPRHADFCDSLARLYPTLATLPLVAALNKQPANGERAQYGASALYAPASAFGSRKDRMLRANMAIEPLANMHSVTRAVLLRYDVSAHKVVTILPRDVSSSAAPGGFLREIVPHLFDGKALNPSNVPVHLKQLFAMGLDEAVSETGLGASHPRLPALVKEYQSTCMEFEKQSVAFLSFLDTALAKDVRSRHANHESHAPAAECDCWKHRANFDSLFTERKPGLVCELVLAVAALRCCGLVVEMLPPYVKYVENISMPHSSNARILLTVSWLRFDGFLEAYFGDRGRTRYPLVLTMRSVRRSVLPLSAARVEPGGALHAARTAPTGPCALVGPEFWTAFGDGSLATKMRDLAGTR